MLYREWIKNKVLLYCIGNYTQYPEINNKGRKKKTIKEENIKKNI